MIGVICKCTGLVIFLISLITGIFSGEFMVFVINIITGFLICISFYAIGEIVDLLNAVSDRTYQLHCDFKEYFGKDEEKVQNVPSASNLQSVPSVSGLKTNSDGTWICSDCSAQNKNNTRFCSSCGKYR